MSTLLITGGAGFIGSNLVHHALAHTADRLVIVDKLTYAGSLLNLEGAAGTLDRADAPDHGAWQQLFLGAPAVRIAGGSDEIQRNILAERVLGLPRESEAAPQPAVPPGR